MNKIRKFLKYTIPNRKRNLMTDAFLQCFKEELDKTFKLNPNAEDTTYYGSYFHISGTGGFYGALKTATDRFNLSKSIYVYAKNLPWYRRDLFDDLLLLLMVKKGIIREGIPDECDDFFNDEMLKKMEADGEIIWVETIKEHKGYRVIDRHWTISHK